MGKEMLLDLQEHEMEATLTQLQKDYLNAIVTKVRQQVQLTLWDVLQIQPENN